MPRRTSQRNAEAAAAAAAAAKKPSSILAPDPDAIPPQIRSNDNTTSDKHDNPGLKVVGPAPYDSDDVANAERDTIDYSIKVSFILFLFQVGIFFR